MKGDLNTAAPAAGNSFSSKVHTGRQFDATTVELARDALSYIPADCDRTQWIKIGGALRHEFGGVGFDLFDAWSQGSADQYDPRGTLSAWRSLKGGISNPSTFKTIAGMARDAGWVPSSQAQKMTPAESQQRALDRALRDAKSEAEAVSRRAVAAGRAVAIVDGGRPYAAADAANNDYLKRHGHDEGYGAYIGTFTKTDPSAGEITVVSDHAILLPIMDLEKKVHSVQAIFPDADNSLKLDKIYLKDGAKRGHFFRIGQPTVRDGKYVVLIAEGFATAATLHKSTRHCVFTAFDAGNLKPVAEIIRAKLPDATIVLCADNDARTSGNPGRKNAYQAAAAVGGLVAIPEFDKALGGDGRKGPTDFNDLAMLNGTHDDAVVLDVIEVVLAANVVVTQADVDAEWARGRVEKVTASTVEHDPLAGVVADDEEDLIDFAADGAMGLDDDLGDEGAADEADEAAPAVRRVPYGGDFDPDQMIDMLNGQFAFVRLNSKHCILEETTSPAGVRRFDLIQPQTFKEEYCGLTVTYTVKNAKGDDVEKRTPGVLHWMKSGMRRTFRGLVFEPGNDESGECYNIWRGLAVKPLGDNETVPAHAERAVDDYFGHILHNVAHGNQAHYRQLVGFLAHMVQLPADKPDWSLILRGEKGTGKNVIVKYMRHIIGKSHSFLGANRRLLTGQFNAHMEGRILFVLDEAFWAGDKQSDSILKDLVTGDELNIERKGLEMYTSPNLARIVMLANEKWVVPASHDERRYGVFDVSSARRGDSAYFGGIDQGMKDGGLRLLLRKLLEWDLSDFDRRRAPSTSGLIQQKVQSLEPIQAWWHESLREGYLLGGRDYETIEWPERVGKEVARLMCTAYNESRNIRGRIPAGKEFGDTLSEMCPSWEEGKTFDKPRKSAYRLPLIGRARQEMAAWLQHPEAVDALYPSLEDAPETGKYEEF